MSRGKNRKRNETPLPAWMQGDEVPDSLKDVHRALGDFENNYLEPNDGFWDAYVSGNTVLPFSEIFPGRIEIPEIVDPGGPTLQKWTDLHFFPRWMQMMHRCMEMLKCGIYFVKREDWWIPPIDSEPIPLFTNLPASVPAGGTATVISFQVPDGMVGSIRKFGHSIDAPVLVPDPFVTTTVSLRINRRAANVLGDVNMQFGPSNDPHEFGSHIMVKWKDLIEVVVTNAAADDIDILVNLPAHMWPAKVRANYGSKLSQHDV